jgi:hypothetical protein
MTEPYTGGCACGAVRYEVSGTPMAENDCQCRQCQRQTGTGHGSYLTFAGAAVSVEGQPNRWEAIGEGGTVKHSAFCAECGSPLFLTFPDMPDVFVVRAGSLDDPARYQPQMVFWTTAGHAWDQLGPDLVKFEKMPPQASAA